MSSSCIYQNNNIGQWEFTFRVCLVKIPKVYISSYMPAFLLHKNYISQPFWKFDLFYEPYLQKPVHFSFDLFLNI